MNTKKKITLLSILISLILVVTTTSITYAIWSSKHVTESNIVQSGCLNMEFKDITESMNGERLSPEKFSSGYEFTVTNTCTTSVNYELNIETLDNSTIDLSDLYLSISGWNIHNNRINNSNDVEDFLETIETIPSYDWIIDAFEKVSEIEEVTPTLSNAIKSNRISRGLLKNNESHFYQIFSYLDDSLENDEGEEKTWSSKITATSTPIKQVKVSLDPDGGNLDSNYVYLTEGDNYKDLPIPKKEGSVFEYWYIDNDETKSVDDRLVISTNHTLKAKYNTNNIESILDYNSFDYIFDYDIEGIESIEPYKNSPTIRALENAINISMDTVPTYMWVENNKLYYYSNADKIYMLKEEFNGSRDGSYTPYKDVKNIDLSGIDTSKVTNMYEMFSFLENLETINLSNFNTSNVTTMELMFYYCKKIKVLDLSSFDTSNVTDMRSMFASCDSLEIINLSSFNTSKVTNMERMFSGCDNLKELDLTSFNLSNINNIRYIFEDSPLLSKVIFNGTTYDSINDVKMLCGTRDDLEIIGYTPTSNAYACSM